MNMVATLFGFTADEAIAGVTREAERALGGLAEIGTQQHATPAFSPHRSAVLGVYVWVGALARAPHWSSRAAAILRRERGSASVP
jgi:hypothetical protein